MEDFDLFVSELTDTVGDADKALSFISKWAGVRLYFPRSMLAEKERQRVRKMLALGLPRSIVMQRLMATGKSRGAAYFLIRKALSGNFKKT